MHFKNRIKSFTTFQFDNYSNEEPRWEQTSADSWETPSISRELAWEVNWWKLSKYAIYGYEYDERMKPYHLEKWQEKSTMNNILIHACKNYIANLISGSGFLSITRWQAVQNEIDDTEVYLSQKPEAKANEKKHNWLHDSSRDYMAQLNCYKSCI